MNKKVPMRRCVGCGESKPKQELIRIVKTEIDGKTEVKADPTGRANGRGIYLCRGCEECFEFAKKKRAIGRGLDADLTPEMLGNLEKELREYEK